MGPSHRLVGAAAAVLTPVRVENSRPLPRDVGWPPAVPGYEADDEAAPS